MLGVAFEDVLRAARTGAAWAFERLWEDLGPLVAAYLRANGAADPDDLASETFIGVFRGIGRFEGTERQLRSWVLTIAHRRLLDERRARGRRPPTDPVAPSSLVHVAGGDVDVEVDAALGGEAVTAALARLTEEQREVLTLRIMGDLTVEQVAAIVGRRPGAVKALQRRGLATLRKIFSAEGVPL